MSCQVSSSHDTQNLNLHASSSPGSRVKRDGTFEKESPTSKVAAIAIATLAATTIGLGFWLRNTSLTLSHISDSVLQIISGSALDNTTKAGTVLAIGIAFFSALRFFNQNPQVVNPNDYKPLTRFQNDKGNPQVVNPNDYKPLTSFQNDKGNSQVVNPNDNDENTTSSPNVVNPSHGNVEQLDKQSDNVKEYGIAWYRQRKKIELPDDVFDRITYEGDFNEKGKLIKGKITFGDHTVYEGEFDENGTFTGTKTLPDGTTITGVLQYGWLIGTQKSSNHTLMSIFEDDRFTGLRTPRVPPPNEIITNRKISYNFEMAQYEGQAYITLQDKTVYQGILEYGYKLNGSMTSPNGTCMRGIFNIFLFNGVGMIRLEDGTTIQGIFENGRFIKGRMALPGNIIIRGRFYYNGRPYAADITLPNKTTINGVFSLLGGLMNGAITLPDGTTFKGGFNILGNLHGQAEVKIQNGATFKGEFNEDRFIRGTITLPDGRVLKVKDGRVFKVKDGRVSKVKSGRVFKVKDKPGSAPPSSPCLAFPPPAGPADDSPRGSLPIRN